MKKIIGNIFFLTSVFFSSAQSYRSGFYIVERPAEKKVDILYNNRLLTAYCYFDSISKPFLFPLKTIDGITITRSYPIERVPGERTDHPHHTGMWMNYESVNGLDFWNNSSTIPAEKKYLYGTILHREILAKKANAKSAFLIVAADWVGPDGGIIIREKTTYVFLVKGELFFIDRITTLTAGMEKVIFKDAKDGLFGLRLARELEMPSKETTNFVDIHGNNTTVRQMNNTGVTGMYIGSSGLHGDSVWGSKGPWTMLIGIKDKRNITIGILDHPTNPGYPAYWHARGYGLFAVNPLGRKIFSNGREELNLQLEPGLSKTFHYRVVVASKKLTVRDMNQLSDQFVKEK